MIDLNFKIDNKVFLSKLKRISKDHPVIARKLLKTVGSGVFDISRNKYINNKSGGLGSKFRVDAFSTTDAWLINKAKHAGVIEHGGRIKAKSGVLHFTYNGEEMFRRSVYIKPQKYFISAIEEMMHSKELYRLLSEAISQEHDRRN